MNWRVLQFPYPTETSLLYKMRIWKTGPVFAPFKFGLVAGLQFLAESDRRLSECRVCCWRVRIITL